MASKSKTAICNLALSHLGVSKEIGNITTEKSASASACRRFFDDAQDEVFRDFVWPFANKYNTLGLVAENPNNDWAFSYRYPSDCRRLIKILSGVRKDSRQTLVKYEIGIDDSGKLIFTDQGEAVVKYISFVSNISFYPTDFIMALSLLLASYIAPRVTAGDPTKLGERALRNYIRSRAKAEANALNERAEDEPVEAEVIRARS